MDAKMIQLYYDEQGKVLYISIEKPRPGIADEIGNDALIRYHVDTGEIVGITIIALRHGLDDIRYDAAADKLIIHLADGNSTERREIASNLIINFDDQPDPEPLSIEILKAGRILELQGILRETASLPGSANARI